MKALDKVFDTQVITEHCGDKFRQERRYQNYNRYRRKIQQDLSKSSR